MSGDVSRGPRGTGVHGDHEHLVLYPTWIGLLASGLVPPGLLLLAWASFAVGGANPVAWGLFLTATATGLWAGQQFPRHVVIGPAGIERRCLLRTHHLGYDEVAAIERGPTPRIATARAMRSDDPDERQRVRSGLVAAGTGRRRWMLTDQPESREEYDRLAALLIANAGTELLATRPQAGSTPTSLYRRRVPSLG